MDDLLRRLDGAGFPTIGYADDLAILLTGRYESVLCNRMQGALNIVEKWCSERSLSVNPAKTEMVLFTKKRKLENMILPKIKETRVCLKKEVKYLGVVLDSKLNWKRHLEVKASKACKALWQCRRTVGRSWGLSPKITLWLYTAVIRPMLCYGAIVWWPRTRLKTEMTHMSHVQRLVCLAVTGAMKSTPTAAMEAVLCLPPLNLFVEEMALCTALRLKDGGLWNTIGKICGHARILREASERMPILQAEMDRIPTSYHFSKSYRIELSDTQVEPDIKIFTDGSKTKRGSGLGIFSEELNLCEHLSLGVHTTAFQAEMLAVMHGARTVATQKVCKKHIRFLTDCRAVLLTLRGHKVNSRLVRECHLLLNRLAESNVVELCWVKGHEGNQGNEEADRLARMGSDHQMIGPEPALPLATTTRSALIKDDTLQRHWNYWVNYEGCRQGHLAVKVPSLKIAKICTQLSRPNLRKLVGIWTGHCKLNSHLHKMDLVKDPACRACYEEDETAEHVLCHCRTLAQIRGSILGELWPSMADIRGTPPGLLLRLINAIGWLD